MDSKTLETKLLEAAWSALDRAYAPYSKYRVGSAIQVGDQIFSGCNVENASYGLTLCAERNAIATARSGGELKIGALNTVLVAVQANQAAWPCGACRQVLWEFGHAETVVMVSIEPDQILARKLLKDLLPDAFGPNDLGINSHA